MLWWKAGKLAKLILLTLMVTGVILSSGCAEKESEAPNQTQAPNQIIKFVTPQQAFDLIQEKQNNPNFVIIDDRKTPEFNNGHIANAINMPYSTVLKDRLDKLDKNEIYLVYCTTGCGATSKIMKQFGFREVYEIEGGIQAWMPQGLLIE
ncbi:rhodanese-like domain-containing protein [Chloroflexota bacterium]